MKTMTAVLYLLLLGAAHAADPVLLSKEDLRAQIPTPTIRFPKSGAVKAVSADAPVSLAKGQWYVIDFEDELLVRALPKDSTGSVTISYKKGPLTVPADVVPGREPDKDDAEVCTIKGPHVYIVKAKDKGSVYLAVIPKLNRTGADGKPVPFDDTSLIVKTIDVAGGAGPRPPPLPDPTVDPVPVPSNTGLIAGDGLRVLITFNRAGKLTAGQQAAVDGKTVRDYLKAHCATERPPTAGDDGKAYRIWPVQEDPAGAPQAWRDAFARPRTSDNWIVISNPAKAGGGTEQAIPPDMTPDQLLALLKKYGE